MMQCMRCLNTDRSYFYKGSKGWYCRKCISFGRVMLEEEKEPAALQEVSEGSEEYILQYPLTRAQAEISAACAGMIDHTDVLLYCVCGAGKTELVVESIARMLKRGKKVCFAIPRRQVVLELAQRLARYFPGASVIAVCGGYTEKTDGDLIVCTTHQLYRYFRAFDLLIMDEPDAFPFRGSDVLHGIAATACTGHTVWLTATPDEEFRKAVREKKMAMLVLNRRPHGHPLPVPEIFTAPAVFLYVRLLVWIKAHRDHPRMIFVPTIAMASRLHSILSVIMKCFVCTGRTENRDAVIESFRREKAGVIIATTVLERGVTIPGADICVMRADHAVFDEASLVQMAGRAGRSFAFPDGDVLFLCAEKSRNAQQCRNVILEANA